VSRVELSIFLGLGVGGNGLVEVSQVYIKIIFTTMTMSTKNISFRNLGAVDIAGSGPVHLLGKLLSTKFHNVVD
jgi:hypothetical protein